MTGSERVDVHHHFIPPLFSKSAGSIKEWPAPSWSPSADQAYNQRMGIKTAILSLSTPGPEVGNASIEQAAGVARDANLYGASLRDSSPSSYGFFASIPSPSRNLAGALSEIAYALDELKADGITLFSSYDGKYLGHADFRPLWEAIAQRPGTVVFVHPTSADSSKEVPSWNPAVLAPVLDFTFETTRTAIDMIIGGVFQRHPDVKIILSHAGGTLPWLWERVATALPPLNNLQQRGGITYDEIKDSARSFYYDTALSAGNAQNVEFLVRFAKPGHVLFGSDFPYAGERQARALAKGIDEAQLTAQERSELERDAALRLFPRLATGATSAASAATGRAKL